MAKKILIVEDEKALASVLNLKLKAAGYETSIVYNGDDALTTIKAGGLDLVLIDIMMPKRDGFSVLEELKKAGVTTPIFVMSNLSQDEDVARVRAYGVKDYIVKADTSPQEILTRVQQFLGN
jgi:DNA-binding response OmpR family regulator